jgi:hypothetical protein
MPTRSYITYLDVLHKKSQGFNKNSNFFHVNTLLHSILAKSFFPERYVISSLMET